MRRGTCTRALLGVSRCSCLAVSTSSTGPFGRVATSGPLDPDVSRVSLASSLPRKPRVPAFARDLARGAIVTPSVKMMSSSSSAAQRRNGSFFESPLGPVSHRRLRLRHQGGDRPRRLRQGVLRRCVLNETVAVKMLDLEDHDPDTSRDPPRGGLHVHGLPLTWSWRTAPSSGASSCGSSCPSSLADPLSLLVVHPKGLGGRLSPPSQNPQGARLFPSQATTP